MRRALAFLLLARCVGQVSFALPSDHTFINGFAAPHPLPPTVVTRGGPVLAAPLVIPIFYDGDTNEIDVDVQKFLSELATSDYWKNATGEYQVGALSIADPEFLPALAPRTVISDSTLRSTLSANVPAWGAPSNGSAYVFVISTGSVVQTQDGLVCCQDFDGYHDEAPVGSNTVPYAVVCHCPGFDGPDVSDIDQMTVALSHEIIETATDPFVTSNPAYRQEDPAHGDCTAITGGEVADLCEFNPGANLQPEGMSFKVQQIYSNLAANAGTDPCLPLAAQVPYFNSVAVLPDTVTLGQYGASASINIAVGDTQNVDVQLFSTAPTTGPWSVQAQDVNQYFYGGDPELAFSWDASSGKNRDTLHLAIHVLSADTQYGGELFLIESTLGAQTNLSYGVVGPK
jgi:hypothetical protein